MQDPADLLFCINLATIDFWFLKNHHHHPSISDPIFAASIPATAFFSSQQIDSDCYSHQRDLQRWGFYLQPWFSLLLESSRLFALESAATKGHLLICMFLWYYPISLALWNLLIFMLPLIPLSYMSIPVSG